MDRSQRAIAIANDADGKVLGLHAVDRRGRRRKAETSSGRPASEISRSSVWMPCVESSAAAIARLGAASGLVVVALRPPVGEFRRGADEFAETSLRQ